MAFFSGILPTDDIAIHHGQFAYTRNRLYARASSGHYHPREAPVIIHQLINNEANRSQRPLHWYDSQFVHYGIHGPVRNYGEAQQHFNSAMHFWGMQLHVPQNLSNLEAQLRMQYMQLHHKQLQARLNQNMGAPNPNMGMMPNANISPAPNTTIGAPNPNVGMVPNVNMPSASNTTIGAPSPNVGMIPNATLGAPAPYHAGNLSITNPNNLNTGTVNMDQAMAGNLNAMPNFNTNVQPGHDFGLQQAHDAGMGFNNHKGNVGQNMPPKANVSMHEHTGTNGTQKPSMSTTTGSSVPGYGAGSQMPNSNMQPNANINSRQHPGKGMANGKPPSRSWSTPQQPADPASVFGFSDSGKSQSSGTPKPRPSASDTSISDEELSKQEEGRIPKQDNGGSLKQDDDNDRQPHSDNAGNGALPIVAKDHRQAPDEDQQAPAHPDQQAALPQQLSAPASECPVINALVGTWDYHPVFGEQGFGEQNGTLSLGIHDNFIWGNLVTREQSAIMLIPLVKRIPRNEIQSFTIWDTKGISQPQLPYMIVTMQLADWGDLVGTTSLERDIWVNWVGRKRSVDAVLPKDAVEAAIVEWRALESLYPDVTPPADNQPGQKES